MYCAYYGLARHPFEMTPDPAFLYLGETHREGLATLVYGVQSGKGFVLLTGEVGTGKTTLLHALLGQLEADTASAFVFNPRLEPLDFFRVLLDEYDVEGECRTKAEYLLALNEFLIERLGQNLKTVLIIDEAQTLSPEMLEEVRLLSNLETPTSKLLQIVLVGQPELVDLLARPALLLGYSRQLAAIDASAVREVAADLQLVSVPRGTGDASPQAAPPRRGGGWLARFRQG